MAETCNSRSFSWLVKSCIPKTPSDLLHHQIRPTTNSSSSSSPISSLPDDLLLDCLSRVPFSSLPSLSLVCRRFSHLLSSPSFLSLRRSHSLLHPTLITISLSFSPPFLISASLPINGRDLPTWSLSSSLFSPTLDVSFRLAAVSRAIFIIRRQSTLRYDTWTAAISYRAPTLFPRKKFAAAVINGKIYIAGGNSRTSAVEVYDPDSDTWSVVAEAPIRRYGCVGASAGEMFYVIGGLRVGGGGDARAAHASAGTMDAYHVRAGAWVRGARAVPGGGCVVGACGVGSNVYVMASHAVEFSFWRWDEKGGRRGGDWTRLEPPPVQGRIGLGGAVRFSCAAVGESKMVAIVHVSPRGQGMGVESMEGAVLVYDITGGEWTRGPDLPAGFRRAGCACVEC